MYIILFELKKRILLFQVGVLLLENIFCMGVVHGIHAKSKTLGWFYEQNKLNFGSSTHKVIVCKSRGKLLL